MKFASISAILGVAALTDAKLGKESRRLVAENAGAYHTDAFEQLAELYAEEMPKSQLDLMMDISDISASYCPEGDAACRSNAYKATMERFHAGTTSGADLVYPENMDSNIKASIDKAFEAISKLDGNNVDSVVQELGAIQNEISDMSGVDAVQQMLGVAALSVGQESASYWTKTYQEENHPFKRFLNRNFKEKRETQLIWSDVFPLRYDKIIAADMAGAIEYSITQVDADATLIFNFPNLVLALIAGAIPSSANMAFNSTAF